MKAPFFQNSGGVSVEGQPVFSAGDPGADLVPIVANDATTFATPYRALRCKPDGTAGTLKVDTTAGTTRTTSIALGETLLLGVTRVYLTGTSAAGLEGYV